MGNILLLIKRHQLSLRRLLVVGRIFSVFPSILGRKLGHLDHALLLIDGQRNHQNPGKNRKYHRVSP